MKRKTIALAGVVVTLGGCGGGSSGNDTRAQPPPPPPQIQMVAAGVYNVGLDGYPSTAAAGGTSGHLIVSSTGEALFSGVFVGRGTFAYSGPGALLTLIGPRLVADDHSNLSVAAFGQIDSRQFQFSYQDGDQWRSGNNTIARRVRSPATFIPLRWFSTRPYTLNGVRETYDLRLQTDRAGGISGSDSTGCVITGSGNDRRQEISDVQLNVTACGPSQFYIRNGTYLGRLFIDAPIQMDRHTLTLIALRTPDADAAISLSMTEEQP